MRHRDMKNLMERLSKFNLQGLTVIEFANLGGVPYLEKLEQGVTC